LTPDRLEKLNSIGFVWSVRGETIEEGDASIHGLVKDEEKEDEKLKNEVDPSVEI
jgi:hypothetical protein